MSGFDEGSVFYTDQKLAVNNGNSGSGGEDASLQIARIKGLFRQFLKEWTDKQTHVYVERLRANYERQQYFLEVNMAHIFSFNEELGGYLRERPDKFLPVLEDAAKEVLVCVKCVLFTHDCSYPHVIIFIVSTELLYQQEGVEGHSNPPGWV